MPNSKTTSACCRNSSWEVFGKLLFTRYVSWCRVLGMRTVPVYITVLGNSFPRLIKFRQNSIAYPTSATYLAKVSLSRELAVPLGIQRFSPKARRPRAGWPQRLPEARNGWLGLKNKTCQLASWESCVFPLYYWKSWYGTIFFNDVSIFLMTMWKFILYTYYILSYCINYLRQLLIMSEHTRNGAIRLLEVCNIFCFFFLKYLVRWILKCWNLKDEL